MADATTEPLELDLADVQGEILDAYDHQVGEHVFLQFTAPESGRAFVRELLPQISTAADWNRKVPVSMNVGLSYSGLAALGLDDAELVSFPYPFRVGMAARAPLLGDTGLSAPDRWDGHYGSRDVHAWLMVQADSGDQLAGRLAAVQEAATAYQVRVLHREPTANFTGAHARAKEHFGFHDGIGEPAVEGAPGPVYKGQGTPLPPTEHDHDRWGDIKLGSFLLGYENEYGEVLQFPSNPKLRRNGTFMAFRKLEQHVTRFRDYIEANRHLVGGDGELLAAKMVGRWRSGAPLELSPEHDDPELAADPHRNNNFRYADDPEGLRVPHLAHIRRVNPRDSLPTDSVVEPRRHRIIRRSMPYGPWLPEGEQDPGGLGLIFRVFNADLLDQFEMVQSQWVASANESGGLSTDQDAIAGLTDPVGTGDDRLESTMRIPCAHGTVTLYGLPRFVTLKGGEYFFVPGISALRLLAAEPETDQQQDQPT